MPYVKRTARPATSAMVTGLPLSAEPALLEPSVLVALPAAAAAALTGAYVRPSDVLQASPERALALSRKVMSAHYFRQPSAPCHFQQNRHTGERKGQELTLYKPAPDAPTVTTWMLASVPSTTLRSAGSFSSGTHSVPLPVAFQNSGVSV